MIPNYISNPTLLGPTMTTLATQPYNYMPTTFFNRGQLLPKKSLASTLSFPPNYIKPTSQYLSKWTNSNTIPCQSRSSFVSPICDQINRDNPTGHQRKKFTEEEDTKLKILVEKMGPKKWDIIAKQMPGRTGRQCRDRYKNYLMPGFFSGQWSKEEDELLHQKYMEYGSQWSKLTKFFTNRSANALKNRWNYFVSRQYTPESDSSQELHQLNDLEDEPVIPLSNTSAVEYLPTNQQNSIQNIDFPEFGSLNDDILFKENEIYPMSGLYLNDPLTEPNVGF